MTRPAKHAIAILFATVLVSCGREFDADRTFRPDLVSDWCLARHRHDSGHPGDPNPPPPTTGEMTWTFDVVP